MTKPQLKKEIKKYIAKGCTVALACQKVNNLHHNEYLSKIYEIQQNMAAA